MEYNPKILYIFCHGYFSPKEVRFLQMLMGTAPKEIQCYHWGDMDYGGIQIYIYNEKNIFPELIPWEMDVASYEEALKNGKGITLNSGKREKLEMLNAGKLIRSARIAINVITVKRDLKRLNFEKMSLSNHIDNG